MAHNIDTHQDQAAFVSAREDAWHGLGTTLPQSFTAEEAMEHGHLGGWNVRKRPLTVVTEAGPSIPVPGAYGVVRNNPFKRGHLDVLGTVGEAYTVIQNEEHAGLLNALVDESGAHFETAGALDGGRKVFITMKLPGHIKIGGLDRVDNYIAAINTHDGSMSFTLMVTPVRIVCQNTMNLAFANHSNIVRIRHSRGASTAMALEARRALELSFSYIDDFQAHANKLIDVTMTQSEFERLIAREFGAAEGAAASTVTRTQNKLEEMASLFSDAGTQKEVRNTAWAGLNALTEWSDHFAPARGEERDIARQTRAILDPSFKNQALRAINAFAGI